MDEVEMDFLFYLPFTLTVHYYCGLIVVVVVGGGLCCLQ